MDALSKLFFAFDNQIDSHQLINMQILDLTFDSPLHHIFLFDNGIISYFTQFSPQAYWLLLPNHIKYYPNIFSYKYHAIICATDTML